MPRLTSTLSLWLATAASCECCPLLLTHPRTYSPHPLFPSDLDGEITSVPFGKAAVMLACMPRADRVPVSQVRLGGRLSIADVNIGSTWLPLCCDHSCHVRLQHIRCCVHMSTPNCRLLSRATETSLGAVNAYFVQLTALTIRQ